MGQGNPNKVNAIVDEIVKNNSVFKLKSPIEQDKEKDSMARSINSALSVLNEVGKELVLQDLSVDPDEKFKGFIDSVGNIDISGLTKMTSTIVKAKIEEAEREGINLRTGEPVFKNDNKISVVEGVLTVAVINEMIKNYDNLSYEERIDIIKNWEMLSSIQRKDFLQKQYKAIDTISGASEVQKSKLKDAVVTSYEAECIEDITLQEKEEKACIDEFIKGMETFGGEEIVKQIKEMKKQNYDNREIYQYLNSQRIKYCKDISIFFESMSAGKPQKDTQIEEFSFKTSWLKFWNKMKINALEQAHENGSISDESYKNAKEHYQTEREKIEKSSVSLKRNSKTIKKLHTSIGHAEEIYAHQTHIQEGNEEKNKISQEIEQLPIALAKAGFSQEEIKEALKNYTSLIKEFDEEVIDSIKDKDNNELKEWLKELFDDEEEFPVSENVKKILQQLAQNDFGGHLQQILTSPELLQETFLPALSAEIEKLEQQPIPDEHTDEYYRSQATTLTLDRNVEEIAKKVQAQGGSVKEITVALAKKIEERATEQSQHSIPEEESKEQKTEQPTPPIFENPTIPEEPKQESATSPEQETLEETGQNMAMVKQDNSFIGKIRRVFANMKDMKNKDNSKGFFARLGTSIKTVFGNKEERYEDQDSTSTAPTPENQSQSTARREPINYITQHFEVNESIARKETEKSKKAKDFSNADDRTTDEEEK